MPSRKQPAASEVPRRTYGMRRAPCTVQQAHTLLGCAWDAPGDSRCAPLAGCTVPLMSLMNSADDSVQHGLATRARAAPMIIRPAHARRNGGASARRAPQAGKDRMMTASLDRAPSDAEGCVRFVETMLSSRPIRSACLASTPQKPQNKTSTARVEERRLRKPDAR